MMAVPASDEAAKWSNLAPGAQVSVSSSRDPQSNDGVIDRRVQRGEIYRYWTSAADKVAGQWVQLAFPVQVRRATVRLYNPRSGDKANVSVQVRRATVRLLDANGAELASKQVGALDVAGTDVAFGDIAGVRSVRVEIDEVSGTFYGLKVASIAEIEVIARG
ncbi:MAG: hypothetical protein H7Z42_02500 [Roseiflexaceae bacterium]|nr:hypothetical protein [Roseiflexaceae bacterium]